MKDSQHQEKQSVVDEDCESTALEKVKLKANIMATIKQIPVLAGKIVEHQECFKTLSTQDTQAAILDPIGFITCAREAWVHKCAMAERQKMKETSNRYIKLISGAETLTLDSTDGTELISKRSDVFDGWIDPHFKNYGCNVKSEATEAKSVQVHEMIKDSDFRKIYGDMETDLDALCLTQGQIIQFCQKYRSWLRTDGCGTFFLFKANNQFFVARVRFGSGKLYVYVRRLSHSDVWYAEYRRRFVLPQLTLES